jgi:hypothetical protein
METCLDFKIEDLEDLVQESGDCFLVDNKKVWMNNKPKLLEYIGKQLFDDQKYIVSLFLPTGDVWKVDLESKKGKYDTVVLVSTKDIMDLSRKCKLKTKIAKKLIPSNSVYKFKIDGYMIMFDYVKKDYTSERQEKEEAMKALMN